MSTGTTVSPYDFAGLWRDSTGLFHIGSGVYYDPLTGRYLTRGGGGPNPYIPVNPLGAFTAPLMVWLLWRRRKGGKYSKIDQIMLVLVLLVGVGGGLAACTGPTPQPTRTLPPPILTGYATATGTAASRATATATITATAEPFIGPYTGSDGTQFTQFDLSDTNSEGAAACGRLSFLFMAAKAGGMVLDGSTIASELTKRLS